LEFWIPYQLASLALGASHHFVDCSVNSIIIQRSTSVKSKLFSLVSRLISVLSSLDHLDARDAGYIR
jgi:hypothetical protein